MVILTYVVSSRPASSLASKYQKRGDRAHIYLCPQTFIACRTCMDKERLKVCIKRLSMYSN